MSVTATFQPASISAAPGSAAALTLRLHNDVDTEQVVKLTASGELAAHTVLKSETIYLEPDEDFEVPVIVDLSPSLLAGSHLSTIQVAVGDSETVAEASINVESASAYAVSLAPERSTSSAAGRHRVVIDNTGNTPMSVEISAHGNDTHTAVELAAPMVDIEPGKTARVELKVHARERFWRGDATEHPFEVVVVGSDGETHQLSGVFEQGPRVGGWVLPAAAGMIGALMIGTLAWFTLLRPSVSALADERADKANEEQQAVLDEKIAELEAAAEQARQLPLGSPADLRLTADAEAGGSANESFTVASDRVLSVTDVVFQNPDGASGRVALLRSGEVLLESELANFRDLDLHFVAPFRFDGSDTVELRVECTTPGPTGDSCMVGASVVGFVDQAAG